MELANTATIGAAFGEGLAALLIAHVFLLPIYAIALLVSSVRRSRRLPSGFRTFLRGASYIHVVALVASASYIALLLARPDLDSHGIARYLLFWFVLLPALFGLLFVRLLHRRSSPEPLLSLTL